MPTKKSKLKVFSLGGLDEIGKNMTVLEYANDIIIVDCGVAFPQDDMLGIDLVIPDFSYLQKNRQKVKGIILTHGHEDHIGSIPYFLRELNAPIYGTKLTLGLVDNKLKEHNLLGVAETHCKGPSDKFKLGNNFTVELIKTTHSIADSVAVAIKTPVGMVIHSGDFKVDYTPISGESINLQRFAQLGMEGVLLFMCESTNVDQPGYTMSERSVGIIFESIFDQSPNQRIMIATFSSNIHRIQQVINSAVKHDRKVLILGRSMINAVTTATELGYLVIPDNIIIEASEVRNYTDAELAIITTGSQGEPMAALSRMASSEHRQIEIKPGDKVIISASPIPGNEKTISRVINELMRRGADVIYEGLMDVHVSGHAKQEEIKLLHALIKPKFLMPIHGEYRHLKQHKELAVSIGMNKDDVFVMTNGDVLELTDSTAAMGTPVQSGQVLVDGLGVGDVGSAVLRDRKHLAQDGLMVVVAGICLEGGRCVIVAGPDIISRGFVYVKESEELIEEAKEVARKAFYFCDDKRITEWNYIRNIIREHLKNYLWQKTKRNPMILPIIMEL
ncbi:MAG: ribonuclease J [Defluviitaleaceae bacterium]|nr:ribonuclease J [Defluviitaleaceae bacterium]